MNASITIISVLTDKFEGKDILLPLTTMRLCADGSLSIFSKSRAFVPIEGVSVSLSSANNLSLISYNSINNETT